MATAQFPMDVEDLPPRTRSWIIAKSARKGVSPAQLIHDELNKNATAEGFTPRASDSNPEPKQGR